MWRSTSALLDTNAARSLLDTPTARSMLSRFGRPRTDDTERRQRRRTRRQRKEAAVPKLGSFEVMNRTIDIAQAALARHTLADYPPDILIEVPRTACRSLEFHRAEEVIDVGHELAAPAPTQAPSRSLISRAGTRRPRRPRGDPVRAPRVPTAPGTRGRADSGRTRRATSSSAKTPNARTAEAAISAAGPPTERRRRILTRRHQHDDDVAVGGQCQVDRAADPAVHVAPFADRHRWPRARHCAAGGHRVDQLDTRLPVERDQLAGRRCRSR